MLWANACLPGVTASHFDTKKENRSSSKLLRKPIESCLNSLNFWGIRSLSVAAQGHNLHYDFCGALFTLNKLLLMFYSF